MSSIANGPPLPPGVNGGLVGTLTIRLRSCSLPNVFARVKFWGDASSSDLHPLRNNGAVEYPLVGSIAALSKYLRDASPLGVTFLRQPAEAGYAGASCQPELVGYTAIPNLCVDALSSAGSTAHGDAPNTIKVVLQHDLQISSPGDSRVYVGVAAFDLIFRVVMPSGVAPPESANMPWTGQRTHLNADDHNKCVTSSMSVGNTESIGQHSDFFTSSAEEKQSLLEELIDLCNDDLSMPTIETSSDAGPVDPYDMWISRIVADASSPPAKPFPSLVSLGPHHSSALRNVGCLMLEVTGLAISTRVASGMKATCNDYYLHCNSTILDEVRIHGDRLEFLVCEKFNQQRASTRRFPSQNGASEENGEVSLLSSAHVEQMNVEFKDDETVRRWLDGSIEFALFCRASTPRANQKLPRVAMLGSKKNSNPGAPGKICVAQACLRLRDVILSDALSLGATLDLTLPEKNRRVAVKAGSLSVRISLQPKPRSRDSPSTRVSDASISVKDALGNTGTLVAGLQSSSSPLHPISMLLSNFAGTMNDTATSRSPVRPKYASSFCQTSLCNQKSMDEEHLHLGEKNAGNCNTSSCESEVSRSEDVKVNVPLEPVKAPPIWLDIRIERATGLSAEATHEKSGRILAGMSCSNRTIGSHFDGSMAEKVLMLDGKDTTPACSWQVAIDAEEVRQDYTTLTLHLWQSSENGDANDRSKSLVGIAKIPFLIEPNVRLQRSVCAWLPGIAADGLFDLLDPRSGTVIGKVRVKIAVGMLRQIRAFPMACKGAVAIQKWWRGRRRMHTRPDPSMQEAEPTGPTEEELTCQDDDPNMDSVHAGFVAQHETNSKCDPTSSPDSLYEEWSQRSLSTSFFKSRLNTVHCSNRASDDDDVTLPSAIENSLSTKEEGDVRPSNDENELAKERDDPSVRSAVSGRTLNCNSKEQASHEEVSIALSQTTHSCCRCDHFGCTVRLERIHALGGILSAWSSLQERAALLPVSGVFLSYSVCQNDVIKTQEEALRDICLGAESWHSRLIPLGTTSTRDAELSLESTIPIPNYEDSTEMILSQTLECKLWFVPVITATISAMIDGNKVKDVKSLGGCTVISTARCPLYHLYTLNGRFKGRIPWNMTVGDDQNRSGQCVGYVTASIRRADLQPSPNQSLSSSIDEKQCSQESANAGVDHAMSILKPTNLEVSFSRGPEECGREHKRQGIDPPEEIKRPSVRSPNSSKRKMCHAMNHSVSSKRCRVNESSDGTCDQSSTKSIPEEAKSNVQGDSDESETICPSDTSCLEDDQEDDAVIYRSLTSVLGSLDYINSKLLRGAAGPEAKVESEGVSAESIGFKKVASRRRIGEDPEDEPTECTMKPDCPGRQIEPPGETRIPLTPNSGRKSRGMEEENVKTCERASSPMSVAHRCADATTSPCGESLLGSKDAEVKSLERRNADDDGDRADQVGGAAAETGGPELDGGDGDRQEETSRLKRIDSTSSPKLKSLLDHRLRRSLNQSPYLQSYLARPPRGPYHSLSVPKRNLALGGLGGSRSPLRHLSHPNWRQRGNSADDGLGGGDADAKKECTPADKLNRIERIFRSQS